MASGDIDDKTADLSILAYERGQSPELDAYLRLAWEFRPIRTFFIPFGAGISEDGETVYISYDIQTIIEDVECENALVRHETTEWGLRRYAGIGENYVDDPLGHRVANSVEFARVRQLLDRDDAVEVYQEIIDTQTIRAGREDFDDKPIPSDLAMYPYEGDETIYYKLMDAMGNERSEQEWLKLHPNPTGRVENVPPPSQPVVDRLKRDTFLYLDPKPPDERFAQCSTCRDWIVEGLCYIHRPTDKVPGSASCCFYVHGEPIASGNVKPIGAVTPEESGLVDREVRCENCKWFDDICMFFKALNQKMPTMFDLDEKVDAKGCCNANQPK